MDESIREQYCLKSNIMKLQKVRRIFKMRNFVRRRNDPERLPLFHPSTSTRDRSPSIDSISTNSSSSSSQQQSQSRPRSYGSFLPNYFAMIRNSLLRSNSSQVRSATKTIGSSDMQRKIALTSVKYAPMGYYLSVYHATICCFAHFPVCLKDTWRAIVMQYLIVITKNCNENDFK